MTAVPVPPLTDEALALGEARLAKAAELVGKLATGEAKWKMTIPADATRDSDIILADAIDFGERALASLRAARADWDIAHADRLARAQERDAALDTVNDLRAALARAEETAAEARREVAEEIALIGELWARDTIDQRAAPAYEAMAEVARIIGAREPKALVAAAPAAPTRDGGDCTAAIHGPACNGIHYAEAPAASEPEVALVYAGITPSGRRDHLVWIAALRREIDYHQHADERLLRTKCGRSTSAGGVILPVDKAVERYAARPCPRCDAASGSGVDAGPTTGDSGGEDGSR